MNLPTKLTLLRIIMIPLFTAVYFINAIPYHYLISAIIFALAAITDFLDGYIARKYNMVTDLGKFLDPIADKVLVSTAFIIMLVSADNGVKILPDYFAIAVAVILARELIISGFRMVAAKKGIVLSADKSGKIKTFSQDLSILILLIGAQFMPTEFSILNVIGLAVLGFATVMTIISGIEYMVKNPTVLKDKN